MVWCCVLVCVVVVFFSCVVIGLGRCIGNGVCIGSGVLFWWIMVFVNVLWVFLVSVLIVFCGLLMMYWII